MGTQPGPLMWCRCCPGLDLLPIRCRGQNGTGAAPPSVLGSQELHCAGCERCQLSSFAHFSHYQGLVWWGLMKLSPDSCNHTVHNHPLDDAKLLCLSPFFSPPSPHAFSAIRTLLILCHSGVFSSAISWPGACALLSLGWVCLVDCSTGTDWHSSWGLQGLHTQSTKHVSVWGAALLPKYEVGVLIYHISSIFN